MGKTRSIKPFVIHCMIMRLSWKESDQYLQSKNIKMSERRFYEVKKEIQESRFERLAYIAKQGFVDAHLERIGQLEMINEEMWKQYKEGNYEAMEALTKIMILQPYLSAFYDASKQIMEDNIAIGPESQDKQDTSTTSAIPESLG
jgi:hypothetical protein